MPSTPAPLIEPNRRDVASADGTQLNLQHWSLDKPRAHVLIVHGYMDHGGRYDREAEDLRALGYACTTVDLRGHGRSGGQRGYVHAWEQYFQDLEAALATMDKLGVPIVLLAHSNGALLAMDYMSQKAHMHQNVVAVAATSPFLAQTTDANFIKLSVGKLAGRFFERLSLPSGLNSNDLSRDTQVAARRREDSLVFDTANAGWFREVTKAQGRVRRLTHFPVPLFYAWGGADKIASPSANKTLATSLQARLKVVDERINEYHEILHELDRLQLIAALDQFFRQSLPS